MNLENKLKQCNYSMSKELLTVPSCKVDHCQSKKQKTKTKNIKLKLLKTHTNLKKKTILLTISLKLFSKPKKHNKFMDNFMIKTQK